MKKITVNGKEIDFNGNTLKDLIQNYNLKPEMIAVERNREIVKKDSYDSQSVMDGDIIELVRFVGGG